MNGIFFDLQTVRARDLGAAFGGILSDGKLSGCALSYSGANLTIARGYYIAKGRLIEIDSAETLETATTAANGYGRLRLVIDLSIAASESSFTQGKFEWDYATTNSFSDVTQNDINDGTNTSYQVEICRVSFANSQITGIVSQIRDAELKVAGVSRLTPAGGGTVNITVEDNTEYRFTSAVELLNVGLPSGNFDCWMRFTCGTDPVVTFVDALGFIGGEPTFETDKTYEVSIKDGVVLCVEVTTE